MMIAPVLLLTFLLGRIDASVLEKCTGLVYFGEDRNPDDGKNNVLPLESFPTATAQRDLFFSALADPSTETFENFTVGLRNIDLFDDSNITASLSGGTVRADPPFNGQYAISGSQYYSSNLTFEVVFTGPISAFGFFGVDIGDIAGQLTFVAIDKDGNECEVVVPHEVDGPSGGVLYFGYIDIFNPFTRVRFFNNDGFSDRFAFDDFTFATPDDVALCFEGITNADETVCCAASCGRCGGCDCDMNTGGATLCCPGVIAEIGFVCMTSTDVGCLLGEYVPSVESECDLF